MEEDTQFKCAVRVCDSHPLISSVGSQGFAAGVYRSDRPVGCITGGEVAIYLIYPVTKFPSLVSEKYTSLSLALTAV